jgi:hypothetical protein
MKRRLVSVLPSLDLSREDLVVILAAEEARPVKVAVEVTIVTVEAVHRLPAPVVSKTMTRMMSNQDNPVLNSPADRRNSMVEAWKTSQCSEKLENLN